MEQSIRTQPPGPRRRPPSRGTDRAVVPAPAAPADSRLRTASGDGSRPRARLRLPWPGRDRARTGRPARLTAIGTGVAAVAGTLLAAGLDRLLSGGLGLLFGLGYLVVCFQLAVRVRFPDLPAAPISGPIAFALALLVVGPVTAPGLTGQLVGLAGGLAVRAGWLFTGTGLAGLICAARWVAQRRLRRAR
ncbi:DUF6542 domain-containing protein [Kitasatospora sp. NPDC059571]|uniref:DUF6542 domain-containing protein n=1 Tax=Kitasatospora sp. NPDC059571 TaxID=3346871 RepID=UPI003699198D